MRNIRDLNIDEIRELIIKNPHDTFFKYSLQDLDITRDFIASYLPDEIVKPLDLSTLKPSKDSFVDSKLKSYFADMLFSVSLNNKKAYRYFLFEHKSKPEKGVPVRLLKYMANIWEMMLQNTKGTKDELPLIIPVVIYHGDRAWNTGLRLSDLHTSDDVKEYIPDYKYLLYDLSQLSKDEIKGNVKTQLFVETLRAAFAKNIMKDKMNRISKLWRELNTIEPGSNYGEVVILYLAKVNDSFNFDKAIEIDNKLKTGMRNVITSVAEKLIEKGRQEGWQEGWQKGRQEGIQLVINNMLKEGFTLKQIESATGATKDEIQEITGLTETQIKELQEKTEQDEIQKENLKKNNALKISKQIDKEPNPIKIMKDDLKKNNTKKNNGPKL